MPRAKSMLLLSSLLFASSCHRTGNAAGGELKLAEFKSVSMSTGGRCPAGIAECWRTLRVTEERVLEQLKPDASQSALLDEVDFASVLEIALSADFFVTVSAEEPVCPSAFGFQVTVTLETHAETFRDPFGQGCVSDEYEGHPYHALRQTLEALASKNLDASQR